MYNTRIQTCTNSSSVQKTKCQQITTDKQICQLNMFKLEQIALWDSFADQLRLILTSAGQLRKLRPLQWRIIKICLKILRVAFGEPLTKCFEMFKLYTPFSTHTHSKKVYESWIIFSDNNAEGWKWMLGCLNSKSVAETCLMSVSGLKRTISAHFISLSRTSSSLLKAVLSQL